MPKTQPLLRLFPVLLCHLIAFGISIPILPALVREFGGAGLEIGAMFTLQALGQLLMASTWGMLSDRMGRRPILLITILGAFFMDLLTAQCISLEQLFAVRFLAGLCAGTVATASALISDATDTTSRSKGMAIVGICFGLGFTIGPGMGAASSAMAKSMELSRSFPFLVAACINVLALILGASILAEPAKQRAKREHNRERKSIETMRKLLERPEIKVMSAFFLAYALSITILETSFYLYMRRLYGYDEQGVGELFAAMGLIAVLVQGGVGKISKRIGDRRMTLLGVALLTTGLIVATLWQALVFLLFWLAVASVGRALLQPGAMSLMSKQATGDEEAGKIMGVMQSAQSVGRIIGPVFGGLLFDHVGPGAPFVAAGLLLGIAGIWWSRRFNQVNVSMQHT